MAESLFGSRYAAKYVKPSNAPHPAVIFQCNIAFRDAYLLGVDLSIQRIIDSHPNAPEYASDKLVKMRIKLKESIINIKIMESETSCISTTVRNICGIKGKKIYLYEDEMKLFKDVMLEVYRIWVG